MTRRQIPTWLSAIVWAAALLLIGATLIPIVVSNRWWVRVLIFPQAQFTILLLLLALAMPFLLDMRQGAAKLLLAVVLGSLAYQLNYLLPYTPLWPVEARTAPACPPEDRVRVLVLNVREGNEQAEPVLALVREVNPDLFLALETDAYWARSLQPLTSNLPNVVSAPRDSPWGLSLYSRLPLVSPEVRYLVEGYVPSLKTGVRLPSGATVDFYGLHPKPPLMHSSARGDAEVMRAAREIRESGNAAIVAGDLNDVPWSYATQHMLKVSGMVNPRVGRAFDATFKAGNPLMRWPLDHVYVTPDFGIIEFEPLRDVGADHFPLLADLCHAPAGRRLR